MKIKTKVRAGSGGTCRGNPVPAPGPVLVY
jgi:hypothetical protein